MKECNLQNEESWRNPQWQMKLFLILFNLLGFKLSLEGVTLIDTIGKIF